VTWALVVALSATIVAVREIDFTPALIQLTSVSNTAGGGWPAFFVTWVLNVAVIQVLGILWFDWMLALPPRRFRSAVVVPFIVSLAVLVSVAIYQMTVDLTILNASPYGSLGRAGSTLLDANASGAVAALWIGGVVAAADGLRRYPVLWTAAGVAACWLAVWASGSRTAFAAALLTTAFVLWSAISRDNAAVLRSKRGLLAAVTGGVAIAVVLALASQRAVGPLARIVDSLDSVTSSSPESLVAALKEQVWIRNGYGTASAAMIRKYPLFGVGVGSFQLMLGEFTPPGLALSPDNAQNWYRHQLAELGIVGSAAWLAWLALFAAFAFRRKETPLPSAAVIRGALVALAAISFVGMPTQEAGVAMTFWALAAWLVVSTTAPPAGRVSRRGWIVAALVLAVYGAGVLHTARHDLRVPMRAQRDGWVYQYGVYPDHLEPDDGFRWTGRRAVVVMHSPKPYVEVTMSIDYLALGNRPDSAQALVRPTVVRLWRDGELVVDRQLTSTLPVRAYLPVDRDSPWVFLETDVSRVFRPRDVGVDDDRELGVRIRWAHVDAPSDRQP
jgi:hypothetical protein